MQRSARTWVFFLLLLSLSGCQSANEIFRKGLAQVSALFGRTASEENDGLLNQTRAHAQFVNELYSVVWRTKPNSPDTFKAWVHTLNEGASYEGIYRGFTRNGFYRELETKTKGSHASSLKVFLREIELLERELRDKRIFVLEDGQPLAKPLTSADLEAATPEGVGEEVFEKSPKIETVFSESSPFTLARVLGEEALRVISEKSEGGEEALAAWYGGWAARTAALGVDFGMSDRNKKDAQFHESWAKMANRDVLVWEVLNRVHRMIHSSG